MTNPEDIEALLSEFFDKNFESLRLESGHSLSAEVKKAALEQVHFYWRKLQQIASTITETEVRLNLPGQTTPNKRKFGIEGVVDIVREDGRTVMYDIKTHDADDVRQDLPFYEHQLNIYAHIWQNLRGQPLDGLAIIATALPDSLRHASRSEDTSLLNQELEKWDPIVPIDIQPSHIKEIIKDFARVVDCIEDFEFAPAPLDTLNSRVGPRGILFATSVCRNCDARFACDSYRQYATNSRSPKESAFLQYLNDYGSDSDQQDWLSSELASSLNLTDLD